MIIKVDVRSDGNAALAEVRAYGDAPYGFKSRGVMTPVVAATASSRRHPADSHNKKVGEALAVARAFQAFGKKLERAVNGQVKHIDDMREQSSAQKVSRLNQKEASKMVEEVEEWSRE